MKKILFYFIFAFFTYFQMDAQTYIEAFLYDTNVEVQIYQDSVSKKLLGVICDDDSTENYCDIKIIKKYNTRFFVEVIDTDGKPLSGWIERKDLGVFVWPVHDWFRADSEKEKNVEKNEFQLYAEPKREHLLYKFHVQDLKCSCSCQPGVGVVLDFSEDKEWVKLGCTLKDCIYVEGWTDSYCGNRYGSCEGWK